MTKQVRDWSCFSREPEWWKPVKHNLRKIPSELQSRTVISKWQSKLRRFLHVTEARLKQSGS